MLGTNSLAYISISSETKKNIRDKEEGPHNIETSGLYYKLITIVFDATSVMLQIVASLTIVIDDAS